MAAVSFRRAGPWKFHVVRWMGRRTNSELPHLSFKFNPPDWWFRELDFGEIIKCGKKGGRDKTII